MAATLVATGLGSAAVIAIRLFTNLASPGWATMVILGLSMIAFQAILPVGLAALLLLNMRNQQNVVPASYGDRFILDRTRIHRVEGRAATGRAGPNPAAA